MRRKVVNLIPSRACFGGGKKEGEERKEEGGEEVNKRSTGE